MTDRYRIKLESYRTREGKSEALWRNARIRARRHGIPFSITFSDIVIPDLCPLLGFPLKMDNRKTAPDSPTLDCKIPTLGYVPGNVWVISFRANTIKNDASLAELETLTANFRLVMAPKAVA